jgi:hypothetical protein
MNVFALRNQLIANFASYVRSFIRINDERIARYVAERFEAGDLWPDPLVQLNPAFAAGGSVDELVERGLLHPASARIFRRDKNQDGAGLGKALHLHQHQLEAIEIARQGHNYLQWPLPADRARRREHLPAIRRAGPQPAKPARAPGHDLALRDCD